MGLLQPAVNQTAFLKTGILGFQGSGKTFTAIDIAIGLCKLTGKKKIAFFDTEKGSDFHIERVKKAGLQLDVVKSRSFVDLCEVIKEAETNDYGPLLIDSVTHVWRELSDSFIESKRQRIIKKTGNKNIQVNLNMKDWVILKQEWFRFSDLFVNSRIHIIACGRAGYEYDISEDEEGKQEIVKSGTKMKAEGEFGYESDLLLEMYKVPVAEVSRDKKAKGFINRCIVLKDRTDTMNAKIIDKPKFKDFNSIIKGLNIGGEHVGVDATRTSAEIFGSPDRSLTELQKRKDIALEEIQAELVKNNLDGRSAETNKARTKLLETIFGKSSKTYIENLPTETLEAGLDTIKRNFSPESMPPEMKTQEATF